MRARYAELLVEIGQVERALATRIADGETGVLCAPGDADELFAALRELAGDPALRARLASGAIAQARRHTWVHVAESVLSRLDLQPASER